MIEVSDAHFRSSSPISELPLLAEILRSSGGGIWAFGGPIFLVADSFGEGAEDRHAFHAEHTSRPIVVSRVLIVDDERLIADSLAQILRDRGHNVRVAYDGAEAIAAATEECPEIVLTDVVMPRVNGVQAAIAIREICPDTRIILFSGQAVTTDLLQEARAAGHDFELWGKPLHPRDLLHRLRG